MSQLVAALRRRVRGGRAWVAVPVVWIAAVSVVDVLAPPDIHLGPLLVAAPAVTPMFGGPWTVGLVAGLAVLAQTAIGVARDPDELLSANHEAQILALVLVGASLVIFCVVRERRAGELRQVRYVADAAQRVVLPPMPGRLGPLRVASRYLAAEAEARIGGDLYGAVRTDSGTRLIVGDVRGKGMGAVEDAALLLGAFRVAAPYPSRLDELVAYLDRSVRRGRHDQGIHAETFITAVVLDIPDEGRDVEMISCGHPPLVVMHAGRLRVVETAHPAPPLGLGELTQQRYVASSFPLAAGGLLLMYTDGVTEARGSTGDFYPLLERIAGWTDTSPEALLSRLEGDLLRHVGGRLDDDAVMIAVKRETA
ncbi:PP2C family protein-serine/threonine phosphatase [Streptomyces sp. NPDC091272]|uniref:PP2C family protein-serine/threonine phosphatase n=1 Tax=Streptomyces sp. NPDC091272 TaxID=3365981 RepID=UPI0037F3F537